MSSQELQPLLYDGPKKPTPLPKAQLATIYAIKLTLPIALTQVLPYFNVLIEKLAASRGADTGYYSGLAHSLFYGAQLISMFFWGRLSDRIGRVPVIVLGAAWTSGLTLLFGLSDTLYGVLLNRLAAGFCYGTTGAIHSVVGELSDETNQSTAFPLYDIVSALGFVIGPLIGGTFENPADKWPEIFGNSVWRKYPYLIPSIISASLSLGAAYLALYVLNETLPGKRKPQIGTVTETSEPTSATSPTDTIIEIPSPLSQPLSVKELLSIPILRAVFASSGALGFFGSCFNNVFVLMAYSPLDQGGLALSPAQIGRALSGMGAVSIVLKLGMPPLLRARGTLPVFSACMRVWPVAFAALPLAAVVARASSSSSDGALGRTDGKTWAAVAIVLFLSRLGCLAFSVVMILTRDYTPGSASLGTANGLAELVQSLAMTVGPTIISSLFALSASKHLLGGYLWAVFMVVVSLFGSWVANRIRHFRE